MDFAIANIDALIQLGLGLLALVAPGAAVWIARAVAAVQNAKRVRIEADARFLLAETLADLAPRALAYAKTKVSQGSIYEQATVAADYAIRTAPDLLARLGVQQDQLVMRFVAQAALEADRLRDKAA